MKRAVVALVIVAIASPLLTGGCKETKRELDEYGDVIMTMPDRARVLSDLTRIRRGLEFYKVEHEGEYPATISGLDLKDLYYTEEYDYDSSTGKVSSKNYPTL